MSAATGPELHPKHHVKNQEWQCGFGAPALGQGEECGQIPEAPRLVSFTEQINFRFSEALLPKIKLKSNY